MNPLVLISSIVLLFSTSCSVGASSSTPRQIRNKRICRSCGQLAKEVSKRMEETAANPRVVQVAARIGADGRPIAGRKIDYLTSDARYLDVFGEICEKMDYSAKSACYLLANEHEDQMKEWFKTVGNEQFLESFCFKELPDCNKEVYDASHTDIEIENYEEDKDKIDDDFMPEAKEENLKDDKEAEESFANQAAEKVKDFRDNFLDFTESIDTKVRSFLKEKLVENKKIRVHSDKFFKQEHYEMFLDLWHFAALSILISFLLPICFVILLNKNLKNEQNSVQKARGKGGKKASKTASANLKVPAVLINETNSESEAAEADDEKAAAPSRKSTRSSKILSSESSPIKRSSRRKQSDE